MALKNKQYYYKIVVIVIMAFIFFQSSLPADLSSDESGVFAVFIAKCFALDLSFCTFLVRKTAHFLEYFALGSVLLMAIRDKWAGHTGVWAWIFGILYAITDEIHQFFVPGRSCEFCDILIDSCGVLGGVLITRPIIWLKKCIIDGDTY